MRLRRRPSLRLAVVVPGLLGVLAAASCGGGDTTSTSTSTSSATPAPLATAPLGSGAPASPGSSASGSASPGVSVVQAGGQVTVIAPLGLNLRAQPSTSAQIIGNLGQGALLTVIDHQAGWYQVKGATKQGYVTDTPQFVSGRHFNQYTSTAKGFSLMYPEAWAFSEESGLVRFRPQAGVQVLTVVTGPTLDALGAPGRAGYTLSATDSVEVYGVTGVIRTFDRSPGAASATSAPAATLGPTPTGAPLPAGATPAPTLGTPPPAAAQLAHLVEIRLTVNAGLALRIDYDYNDATDLGVFQDMVNSMYLPAASVTPSPAASSTP